MLLILVVSLRDLSGTLGKGLTIAPAAVAPLGRACEVFTSALLGQRLSRSNPARQLSLFYLHAAGIDSGYGYFAPNVPESCKLVFEARDANGHVVTDLPVARSRAAALRLAGLLDYIGAVPSERFREIVIKMMATAAWDRHPDAVAMRVTLCRLHLPAPRDFLTGVKPNCEILYDYDFTFGSTPPSATAE